jgi:fructose-bisphosphate aldolase class 1
MSTNDQQQEQREQIAHGRGFFAALDQSGGSTPKALKEYGIEESAYASEQEMFDLVHAMRTRVITSPAFTGDRILAAILFEQTMDRTIDDMGTTAYLWERKHVVPILKIMLKISIPSVDRFYNDVMAHPRMMRVVALSGGYSRAEADERLSRDPSLIASFSRALLEGLSAQQSDEQFNATLEASIAEIYAASTT